MKSQLKTLAILMAITGTCVPVAAAAVPPAESPVALVSKVVLDVTRKEAFKDWQIARRGETLSSGDRVKTGEKSVAVIKFKDNSMVRVRELSELTVTGTTNGSSFSKSVNVESGVVGFNIKKQRSDEEFRFTSPTSVASIRGTSGKFVSGGFSDTLTIIEGAVLMTNSASFEFVEVRAGYTGISNSNGTISTRPATQEELTTASNAARVSDQENKLEIELRDNQGNRKELKIEIKE